MAFEITQRALIESQKPEIRPNLVMVIDGVPSKYGVLQAKEIVRFDNGLLFDSGTWFFDGLIPIGDANDFISLSGTSDTISQQIDPDKASSSSTQTLNIRLSDFGGEITRLITPDIIVPDILYRNVKVYLGLDNTSFPDDYVEIFNGKIQSAKSGSGYVDFAIAHPDDIKRSNIFLKADTKSTAILDYRSATINDILYLMRSDVTGTGSIQYINDVTLGSEYITSIGNAITVHKNASSTASRIRGLIENSIESNQIVTVQIVGSSGAAQTYTGTTNLDSDTEVLVDDVALFLPQTASPVFKTYVKIDNEVIEYTGIDTVNSKLTGCVRASLGTLGNFHNINASVSSFYKLGDSSTDYGNAIDIALWTLLSGAPTYYVENLDVESIVQVAPMENVTNAILFSNIDIEREYGVSIGDLLTVTGSGIGGNNVTDAVVRSITKTDIGSYVVLSGVSLSLELASPAVVKIKSQYNILPSGCGMSPSQVDVKQFRSIKETFSTSLANYEFYLKDDVNAKEFINEQVLFPSALYSIPRKGRVSVGITSAPLFNADTKILNESSVKKPSQLQMSRSVAENFYNAVVFKYDENVLDDSMLSGKVTLSNDSTNRIAAPTKPFKVFATGLRSGTETSNIIERNSSRILDRYRYGSESVTVETDFKTGWGIEISDTVVFGSPELKLSDITRGDRDFQPRIFEVMNKSFNWKTGFLKFELLDTAFSNELRYGVISPSSELDSGSTTTELKLKDSFGTISPKIERDKWSAYVGKEIRIRSADFTYDELTYFQGISPTNDYVMTVSPALPSAPIVDYIVDIVDYVDVDSNESFYKMAHVFMSPQVVIVSGIGPTQFTVSAPDVAKFFIGSKVLIHNYDYSINSIALYEVSNISGVTITLSEALDFTPSAGQYVDFIGFSSDNGKAYAYS